MLLKRALFAVAALAAVSLVVWLLARGAPSNPPANAPARSPEERAREVPRDQAVERLRLLQRESASLMPDDVRGVFIGLSRAELTRLRPSAAQGRGAPPGQTLYHEALGNGAVVAYLIATRLDRVAQVQFLSRLPDPARLVDHYAALRDRYGDPTAFFDCPRNGDTAPTRRIVWASREAAVMEAVLAHPGGVSLTLAVAGKSDIAGAMRSNGCVPVTRERFADWPVATELRGERVPVPRPR